MNYQIQNGQYQKKLKLNKITTPLPRDSHRVATKLKTIIK
jgi:hypothetical protein